AHRAVGVPRRHVATDPCGAAQLGELSMPTGNGITADTPVNLVVGAGALLRAHAYFGASIDNNLFAVDREMFTPDLNGIMADLMGTDYITRSVGRIEAPIPGAAA